MMTSEELHQFNRLLHQRRDEEGRQMSVHTLAKLAVVGRSHLNLVLKGARAGAHTWPLIYPLLTEAEASFLGKLDEWHAWRRFHAEQTPTAAHG